MQSLSKIPTECLVDTEDLISVIFTLFLVLVDIEALILLKNPYVIHTFC